MNTLQVKLLSYIQHIQSVKVNFTHPDLPTAFAEMILPLPVDADGMPLAGEALIDALAAQAPSREWFQRQEQHLTGEVITAQNLPPELQAIAPLKALHRPLEWYEDSRVGEPEIVGGQWVKPVLPIDLRDDANLADLKVRLIAKLAAVRWQHEVGGIVVNGEAVKTDRESRGLIRDALDSASVNPDGTVSWKSDSGFVTRDASEIAALRDAVNEYVHGCFSHENALTAQINAANSLNALLAVNIESGWPE